MTETSDSILQSTKKVLQIDSSDPSFDLDVIMHVNSAFSTLCQVGVGDDLGFEIADESAVWTDFLSGNVEQLNRVKTYVYLYVKRLFDPPGTAYLSTAMDNQMNELIWRISVTREDALPEETV